MSRVTTEAVRTSSPVIELGDSLRVFLQDVPELRSTGGGARGSGSRVTEQMKRLFGSLLTAAYTGDLDKRGFTLRNVLTADDLWLSGDDSSRSGGIERQGTDAAEDGLWTPRAVHEAGQWHSQVYLSSNFHRECVNNPVPIDLRAYKALRSNPLAIRWRRQAGPWPLTSTGFRCVARVVQSRSRRSVPAAPPAAAAAPPGPSTAPRIDRGAAACRSAPASRRS